MTQRQKELLVLATHFYTEWNDSSDSPLKDFKELISVANKNSKKITDNEIIKLLESGYAKLHDITSGKDITANALILSLGCLMLLLEDMYFKGSTAMTVRRLALSLYKDIEKEEQSSEGFRNANKLISQYDDYTKDIK